MATRKNQIGKEPISSRVYCDDDDDSDTSDTEDTRKRKVRARYLTMSRRKKKEEKEKKKRMKMTQVNMGGVPFQTRSSQPIYVPEYSQDDLEEEDEDEEDEENEFDEDDVQDSVRMGAHHRDTPMYNLSNYPPPRYSSCPRPGPGGLPSPPTPIPSPMSVGLVPPAPLRHLPPTLIPEGELPVGIRERLDRFTELEVKWEPFGPGQQGIVPRTIYSGWIMYRNLQEPYMPDRCIRQIGYVQSIPRSPMSPDDAFREPRTTQYFVEHSAVDTLSTWRRFPESAHLSPDCNLS
ncbi:OLC1v1023727C1 [Oldenlandia corymbosa var. corymbosa]|uniref:OLC1v1023727C1 n=1 Tax=Oldenlandia corymbosa var. corymbosa TaxID=529605 RepID=A0AAV1C335_OLDCO|nr:OLC1v1023727C1 [Oldenlandia corymbosa var. corymbosa]